MQSILCHGLPLLFGLCSVKPRRKHLLLPKENLPSPAKRQMSLVHLLSWPHPMTGQPDNQQNPEFLRELERSFKASGLTIYMWKKVQNVSEKKTPPNGHFFLCDAESVRDLHSLHKYPCVTKSDACRFMLRLTIFPLLIEGTIKDKS